MGDTCIEILFKKRYIAQRMPSNIDYIETAVRTVQTHYVEL